LSQLFFYSSLIKAINFLCIFEELKYTRMKILSAKQVKQLDKSTIEEQGIVSIEKEEL